MRIGRRCISAIIMSRRRRGNASAMSTSLSSESALSLPSSLSTSTIRFEVSVKVVLLGVQLLHPPWCKCRWCALKYARLRHSISRRIQIQIRGPSLHGLPVHAAKVHEFVELDHDRGGLRAVEAPWCWLFQSPSVCVRAS